MDVYILVASLFPDSSRRHLGSFGALGLTGTLRSRCMQCRRITILNYHPIFCFFWLLLPRGLRFVIYLGLILISNSSF